MGCVFESKYLVVSNSGSNPFSRDAYVITRKIMKRNVNRMKKDWKSNA
jgi:hypothetical protein